MNLLQSISVPSDETITKIGGLIVTTLAIAQYVLPRLRKKKHDTGEIKALISAISLSEDEREKLERRITLLERRIKEMGGNLDGID